MTIEIHPISGVGEVRAGTDLAPTLLNAVTESGFEFVDGDILVVTHKVVSKAEGRVTEAGDDDAYRRLVEREAAAVLRRRGPLTITKTRHGFICANAGVDRSNVEPGHAVLLPSDPDRSAHSIRMHIRQETGTDIAVVVTDTFGRAWRRGLTDVAIGVSGMQAILDLRGTFDSQGRVLEATEIAIVDEIAAAADLVMGKATGVPAALVRGFDYPRGEGRAADLIREPPDDMFR